MEKIIKILNTTLGTANLFRPIKASPIKSWVNLDIRELSNIIGDIK